MKRLLLLLLVVPLGACGVSQEDHDALASHVEELHKQQRAEHEALALRVDSIYDQVVELTAWAREGIAKEVLSVNEWLQILADIEKTYDEICREAKEQKWPVAAKCPGEIDTLNPPGEKPPPFPPN